MNYAKNHLPKQLLSWLIPPVLDLHSRAQKQQAIFVLQGLVSSSLRRLVSALDLISSSEECCALARSHSACDSVFRKFLPDLVDNRKKYLSLMIYKYLLYLNLGLPRDLLPTVSSSYTNLFGNTAGIHSCLAYPSLLLLCIVITV